MAELDITLDAARPGNTYWLRLVKGCNSLNTPMACRDSGMVAKNPDFTGVGGRFGMLGNYSFVEMAGVENS
ncbi:MAG: hypothetical protein WCI23_12560 [Chlorobiaceae bacterium]|jgi:hypothetical protein